MSTNDHLQVSVPWNPSDFGPSTAYGLVMKMIEDHGFQQPKRVRTVDMAMDAAVTEVVLTLLDNKVLITALAGVAIAYVKARHGRTIVLHNKKTGKSTKFSGLTTAEFEALVTRDFIVEFLESPVEPAKKPATRAVSTKKVD